MHHKRQARTQRHHSEALSTIGALQLCSDDIHAAVSTINGKVRRHARTLLAADRGRA